MRRFAVSFMKDSEQFHWIAGIVDDLEPDKTLNIKKKPNAKSAE
jgi:hypothetical protein